MTAEDIRVALRKRYADSRQYAVAEEVSSTTGGWCRRLDMVILDCFESNHFRVDGFEIKVSTSDLRRELENPDKHTDFFDSIDYYTLAVPAKVVDPLLDIIPKKWGILIVNEDYTCRYKRRPLALEDKPIEKTVRRGFFASFVRKVQTFKPSEKMLITEYQRGFENGVKTEKERAQSSEQYVKNRREDLEQYDKLQKRFHLWSFDGDIEQILASFESFRRFRPDWMVRRLKDVIKDLQENTAFIERLCTVKVEEKEKNDEQ